MTAMPDMEFCRLTGDDIELAVGLAASLAGVDDAKCECWGVGRGGAAPLGCEVWGGMVRGALAGALWLAPCNGGTIEVKALVLPRKRWGMGLAQWMLARAAENNRGNALSVKLSAGSVLLGELLEEAGFTGPQQGEESYPAGVWIRG